MNLGFKFENSSLLFLICKCNSRTELNTTILKKRHVQFSTFAVLSKLLGKRKIIRLIFYYKKKALVYVLYLYPYYINT